MGIGDRDAGGGSEDDGESGGEEGTDSAQSDVVSGRAPCLG